MKNNSKFSCCDLISAQNKVEDFVFFDLKQPLSLKDNCKTKEHTHNFYQITYIKNGRGLNYIDGVVYDIEKKDVFFITPGQSHRWDLEDNLDGVVINFTNEFIANFLAQGNVLFELPFFKNLSIYNKINVSDQSSRIESILDKIQYEIQLLGEADLMLLRVYLIELLIVFRKRIDSEATFTYSSIQPIRLVKQFEMLIEQHFHKYRFPKEYANLLHVTPNYLNATCKKIKGQPAGDLIRNRVLLESKRLLINSNLSASEISFKLNFKDNSYFSRFFKKHVGMTPDEYRKA